MATRSKISLKPGDAVRDPLRPRVRAVNAIRSTAKAPPPDGGDRAAARTRDARGEGGPRRPQPRPVPGDAPPGDRDTGARPARSPGPPRPGAAAARPRPDDRPARAPSPDRAARPRPQDRTSRAGPDTRAAQARPQDRTTHPRPDARVARPAPGTRPAPPSPRPLRPAAPATAAAATGVRVAKLVAERGLASRREADDWIAAGWVRVDGRVAVLGQRVAVDAPIEIDPRARAEQARFVTVLLHKPVGYVSGQPEDGHEPAVVLLTAANHWSGDRSGIEFHPGHLRHLAPAGRLDIDSTGLLVFTQDGRVAKALVGDQTRIEKEYLVRVAPQRGAVDGTGPDAEPGAADGDRAVVASDAVLARLRQGLSLDGLLLRPAQVSRQNEEQLRFVLREGRKRQIRRMCELVGLQVLGLKRVRIGSVPLGPLPPGQWRYLRGDERF